ncbi:hypothetical protein DERP_008573 [Dermatophagoides pteronyssinus]|uniref:Uncharacterized protein n=1 Tax=Dermatophagoides pteronyssinus TaxID=6956 RepID=A0ABQ8IX11_DERPT|nr:hypothetical protein DERP_008573 [Dermatophagoides pteronyssinus]
MNYLSDPPNGSSIKQQEIKPRQQDVFESFPHDSPISRHIIQTLTRLLLIFRTPQLVPGQHCFSGCIISQCISCRRHFRPFNDTDLKIIKTSEKKQQNNSKVNEAKKTGGVKFTDFESPRSNSLFNTRTGASSTRNFQYRPCGSYCGSAYY